MLLLSYYVIPLRIVLTLCWTRLKIRLIREIVIEDLKYFYLLFYEPFILYLLTLLAFLVTPSFDNLIKRI